MSVHDDDETLLAGYNAPYLRWTELISPLTSIWVLRGKG